MTTTLSSPSTEKQPAAGAPTAPPPASTPPPPGLGRNQAAFTTAQGFALTAKVIRLTRFSLVFELLNPPVTLTLSETLKDCHICLQTVVYSGSASVHSMVDDGISITCEAFLRESDWLESTFKQETLSAPAVLEQFKGVMRDWQKNHLISSDYKVAVADQGTLLGELRLWLDHLELQVHQAPPAQQPKLLADLRNTLQPPIFFALQNLFETFELVSDRVSPEQESAHHSYIRHHLHQYWLGSPFMHRTFFKPLGYAGDYEMMNMIVRGGWEGDSLFAQLINAYLLDQAPCRAVRNRVGFLEQRIVSETARVSRGGNRAKIFAIACGPAWEASNFISDHPLADHAEFTLLDFNEETLKHTETKISRLKQLNHRQTRVEYVRNSVQNLLRGQGRKSQPKEYDLIYCSGLYDYLSDNVCAALNSHLYDQLRPGGLLVVGNFATSTPGQNLMEHLMDWFLIYRNSQQLMSLAPRQANPEDCAVRAEPMGANIFLEVRKPG